MKLRFLCESRTSINDVLIRKSKELKGEVGGVRNAFVSFTSLEKLGVNPQTVYKDTPIGVYAYPLDYVVDFVGDHHSLSALPFAGNQPYVNVFTIKSSAAVVDLTNTTKQQLEHYTERLVEMLSDTGDQNASHLRSLVAKWAADETNGYSLWAASRWVAARVTSGNEVITWNKVLRTIGIDACIDFGDGVIHEGEPTQLVVLNPQAIDSVERFDNKGSPADVNTRRSYQNEFNGMTASDIIQWMNDQSHSMNEDAIQHVPKRYVVQVLAVRDELIPHVELSDDHWAELMTVAPNVAGAVSKRVNPKVVVDVIGNGSRDDRELINQITKSYGVNIPVEVQRAIVTYHPMLFYTIRRFDQSIIDLMRSSRSIDQTLIPGVLKRNNQ